MPTHTELWQAQLDDWPNSVRLDFRTVLEWIAAGRDADQRHARALNIVCALQYQAPVVFYTCGESQQWRGARYGLEPHEYFSFSDV